MAIFDPASDGVRRFTAGPRAEAVAVDPARDRLYVLHLERPHGSRGAISVLDLDEGTVLRTVTIGRGPTGIAVEPRSGLVYAVNWTSRSVSVVDPVSGSVTTIGGSSWGRRGFGWPTDAVAHPDSGRVYVATTRGVVLVIRGNRLVGHARSLPSSDDVDLAVHAGKGMLFAAHYPGRTVTALDLDTLSVGRRLRVPGMAPESIAIDARLGLIGVLGLTRDEEAMRLAVLDLSGEEVGSVDLGIGAFDVATVAGSWLFHVSNSWGDDVVTVAADGSPPGSAIESQPALEAGTPLEGSATDDLSGIVGVRVTYEGGDGKHDVDARLRCSGSDCRWWAPPPALPGTYAVSVIATDRAGNVEAPGAPTLLTWKP